MSYQLRNYRHRNPKGGDEKKASSPFFKSPQKGAVQKKKREGFFQGVQRLATSKEDEKLATNDARMEKDKEEPMKPVQKKDAPDKKGADDKKKKEEKPVQKTEKTGEEKKKKPGKNAGGAAVKKTDKPKKEAKEKEKPVQKKEERKTSASVADEIKQQDGKGSSLPPEVLAEMNHAFGVDFCYVKVHYDAAAAALCRELHAVAFTHGQDIYFNEGMYNPHSDEGKKLLAHELTHVVQQANSTPL